MNTQEARERLLNELVPGDTIYTVLRHISKSGMTRWIDLYVIRDNEPERISYYAALVLGARINEEGIKVRGGGMDMGFHLVYRLSCELFDAGYKLVQKWL